MRDFLVFVFCSICSLVKLKIYITVTKNGEDHMTVSLYTPDLIISDQTPGHVLSDMKYLTLDSLKHDI